MRYRCFYITDADHVAELRSRLNATVDPQARKRLSLSLGLITNGPESYKAVEVEADSFEFSEKHPVAKQKGLGDWISASVRLTVKLPNGDEFKDINIFDMETTPPTLVHNTVSFESLRKLNAKLPPLYINQHGSVVNDKGEIIMRGENEPQKIERVLGSWPKILQKNYAGDFATYTIHHHPFIK